MLWCPCCKTEYPDGTKSCKTCAGALTASEPVSVYTAASTVEGEMLCELLQNAGIAARVRESAFGQITKAYMGDSRFGTEVLTQKLDAEQARALIDAFYEEHADELDEQTLSRLADEQAEQSTQQPLTDNAAFRMLPIILLSLAVGMVLLFLVSRL